MSTNKALGEIADEFGTVGVGTVFPPQGVVQAPAPDEIARVRRGIGLSQTAGIPFERYVPLDHFTEEFTEGVLVALRAVVEAGMLEPEEVDVVDTREET